MVLPQKKWSYVFDEQTILIHNILKVGVASAGFYGKYCLVNIDLK